MSTKIISTKTIQISQKSSPMDYTSDSSSSSNIIETKFIPSDKETQFEDCDLEDEGISTKFTKLQSLVKSKARSVNFGVSTMSRLFSASNGSSPNSDQPTKENFSFNKTINQGNIHKSELVEISKPSPYKILKFSFPKPGLKLN